MGMLIQIHYTGLDVNHVIIVAGSGWEGSQVCGGDHVDAHGGGTGGGGEHYFFTILFMFLSVFRIRV
jgi:hypothetical protein